MRVLRVRIADMSNENFDRDSKTMEGGMTFTIARLMKEVEDLKNGMKAIAFHEHNTYSVRSIEDEQYSIGVTDGHRCAAKIARDVLDGLSEAIAKAEA
jgi:hypothetical protein